jgi:hypothetical protein
LAERVHPDLVVPDRKKVADGDIYAGGQVVAVDVPGCVFTHHQGFGDRAGDDDARLV